MAEMRDYEEYFERADLDKDGKISYDEAVAFMKNFGLHQQVIEEIWRTRKLSRGEFIHALRLVTTIQKATGLTLDQIKPFVASNVEPTRHGIMAAAIPAPKFIKARLAGEDHRPEENIALTQPQMKSATPAPQESGNNRSKKKPYQKATLATLADHMETLMESFQSDLRNDIHKENMEEAVLKTLEFAKRLIQIDVEQKVRKLEDSLRQLQLENTELLQKSNEHSALLEELDLAVSENEKLRQKIDRALNYDHLVEELDLAVSENEKLRQKRDQMLAVIVTAMHREFSPRALQEATKNYSSSRILGKGTFGCVYRGELRGTTVAVKVLLSHDILQERSQFEQEAITLSMVRHPHLISLLGACAERYTLVYEFMKAGSLEDFLRTPDKRRILTWQIRVRIIAEICSALIFLHKNEPHPIAHGDIKADNILLDGNLISKLSDFGLAHVLIQCSKNNTNLYQTLHPGGTIGYMDPEYAMSGVLTCQSDVFSFGVLIMRLLTAMPVVDRKTNTHISKSVAEAMDRDSLGSIVDTTAGGWPDKYISQLSFLALRCTNIERKNRPDLSGELWGPIKAMWAATELPPRSYSRSVRDKNQVSGRNR